MTGGAAPDPGPLIRPYALTDGRTEPSGAELAVEDLVGAASSAGSPAPWLSLEHLTIVRASSELLSVAELAARLDVPLGVARVLVGDLAQQGMVVVHRAPSHAGAPGVALLEQVLQGLQRL